MLSIPRIVHGLPPQKIRPALTVNIFVLIANQFVYGGRSSSTPILSMRSLTATLAAAAMLLGAGCAQRTQGPRFLPPGAASASVPGEAEQPSPFGGKPAVDIPPQARAMGAFLQAEVATEEGDRTEALKALEEAVQYDPDNAMLRVTLATLDVRDGRLQEAHTQVDAAINTEPGSSSALLL